MRKTIVIALREYLAAVKAKSFLISLVLLPVMMSGGVVAQRVGKRLEDTSVRKVAVIDRTPNAAVFDAIQGSVREYNRAVTDSSGVAMRSPFGLEKIEPADLNAESAADQQRLELSNRVRRGDLLAFVEIGPDLLNPASAPTTARGEEDEPDDRTSVRYSSNRPTYRDFLDLLDRALPQAVRKQRLANAGMDYERLRPLLDVTRTTSRGLAEMSMGKIVYESRQGQLAPFIVPLAFVMMMYMVVIVGASPMTGNVIEEKQLRIAEVLLGSVRPFELMMGKLIGGVGVALTLAAIYFTGAYYVASISGLAQYVVLKVVIWFVVFTIFGTMMYGSMFVAAGAAVTNLKEAQSMMMPAMLLVVMPMFFLGPLLQDPSGRLGTIASMLPFTAPMVMTARISIPPGVPVWQALVAIGVTISTTVVLVWCAGRIFRIGLLMQGQGARYADLLRWIIRG